MFDILEILYLGNFILDFSFERFPWPFFFFTSNQ